MPKPRDPNSIFTAPIISYRDAVRGFNSSLFDDKFYGVPKKGSASYNMIQDVRQGKDIAHPTTIKELIKPEEPKVFKKPPKAKKEKPAKKTKAPVVPKNGLNKIVVENIEPKMSATKTTEITLTISQTSVLDIGETFTKNDVIKEDGIEMWNKMVSIAKIEKGKAVIYFGINKTDSGDGEHLNFDIDKPYKYKEPVLTKSAPANINKILVYGYDLNNIGETYTKSEFLKQHSEDDWEKALKLRKGDEVILPTRYGGSAGDNDYAKKMLFYMLEDSTPVSIPAPTPAPVKLTKEQKKELVELNDELKKARENMKKVKEWWSNTTYPRGQGWLKKERMESAINDIKEEIDELKKQIEALKSGSAPAPAPAPVPEPEPVPTPAPAPVPVEKPEFEMVDGEKIYNNIDWTPSINHEGILKILNKMYNRPSRDPLKWVKYTERTGYFEMPININEMRTKIEKTEETLKELKSARPRNEIEIRGVEYELSNYKASLDGYINWRPHKMYRIDFLFDTYTTDKVIKSLGDSKQEKQWKEILQSTYDKVKKMNEDTNKKTRKFNVLVKLKENSNTLNLDWRINRQHETAHHTQFDVGNETYDFSTPFTLI